MEVAKCISKALKNRNNLTRVRDLFLYTLFRILFRDNNGDYIVREEWDNLIILDACRYDVFEEEFKRRRLKDRLEYRISRGTDTPSFLLENFGKGKGNFNDIIYITANPFVDRLLKDKFYKIISIWKYGWNEKYQTVLPETVYEYALYAMTKYPNKRLIIHFIQPHFPYIGYRFTDSSIEELRISTLNNTQFKGSGMKVTLFSIYASDIYLAIDVKTHLQAYRQNLKLVLPYVEKLIDILPGRTVVTADHGEAFGEKIHPLIPLRVYGHLGGIRIPALVKVPWLVVEPEEKESKSIKDLEKELAKLRLVRETEKEDEKLKKAIKNLKLKGKV